MTPVTPNRTSVDATNLELALLDPQVASLGGEAASDEYPRRVPTTSTHDPLELATEPKEDRRVAVGGIYGPRSATRAVLCAAWHSIRSPIFLPVRGLHPSARTANPFLHAGHVSKGDLVGRPEPVACCVLRLR